MFLRLRLQRTPGWQDKGEFFGAASAVIRRVLIDHARKRPADKRNCDLAGRPLELAFDSRHRNASAVGALNDAHIDLARLDRQKAQVVELREFRI